VKSIPVFYSDSMVVDNGGFSPSSRKPADVVKAWKKLGISLDIRSFKPATRFELADAHDREYVDGVLDCNVVNGFGSKSPAVAATLPYTVGSMIAAAREAERNGIGAVSPTSGFHHAGYDSGGAFCTFNGLMVPYFLIKAYPVGILDFDQHYGNGTDEIINRIKLKGVVHYTQGKFFDTPEEFFAKLPRVLESFSKCQIVFYQAGADPHINDPLGGFLTTLQLAQRDEIVLSTFREMKIPVVWNLGGGYQTPLNKVVAIHSNTMKAAANAWLD